MQKHVMCVGAVERCFRDKLGKWVLGHESVTQKEFPSAIMLLRLGKRALLKYLV